jgi:hypothetical protein
MAQEVRSPVQAHRTIALVLLAAAFALFAIATPAQAHITGDHYSGDHYALMYAGTFKVPLPPGDVTITRAECPAFPGERATCAYMDTGAIYMAELDRFSLAHELGHVFDARVLTEPERARLARLLGMDGAPWENGTGEHCTVDAPCPSELFADAYATCATRGDDIRPRRTRRGALVFTEVNAYGYRPTPRQHRRVCRAIRTSGA